MVFKDRWPPKRDLWQDKTKRDQFHNRCLSKTRFIVINQQRFVMNIYVVAMEMISLILKSSNIALNFIKIISILFYYNESGF
jgi:hypothetical protein